MKIIIDKYGDYAEARLDFGGNKITTLYGFSVKIDEKSDQELLNEATEHYNLLKSKLEYFGI